MLADPDFICKLVLLRVLSGQASNLILSHFSKCVKPFMGTTCINIIVYIPKEDIFSSNTKSTTHMPIFFFLF